jgi:hypothetical protein
MAGQVPVGAEPPEGHFYVVIGPYARFKRWVEIDQGWILRQVNNRCVIHIPDLHAMRYLRGREKGVQWHLVDLRYPRSIPFRDDLGVDAAGFVRMMNHYAVKRST